MTRRGLYVAWGALIALSLGSTALSLSALWTLWPAAAGVAVLALAWLKARIILSRYLGLAAAPTWMGRFDFALAFLCLLLLGLYLLPLAL
jgi:nitric oxide reductase NorF protein